MTQGQVPPVSSDRRSIELALLSVLQNSLEACTARGGGVVSVLLHREEGVIAVEVSDDGGGIAETVKPLVFEPFAATRAGSHGLGLGLITARMLVENQGGSIAFVGSGPGARFEVQLPVDEQKTKD